MGQQNVSLAYGEILHAYVEQTCVKVESADDGHLNEHL